MIYARFEKNRVTLVMSMIDIQTKILLSFITLIKKDNKFLMAL